MAGNDINPVAFLNKSNPVNILSANIHIRKILFPTPDIFSWWWMVFDLEKAK